MPEHLFVIPAKAGTQRTNKARQALNCPWAPAFAGVTKVGVK
jgi:hypothetical protein